MTRQPITLSREMKILLTALGLVALLGGWLVMNNRQQADTTATTVTAPANQGGTDSTTGGTGTATKPDATPVGGNAGTDASSVPVSPSAAAGNNGVDVASDGKTEIATVPPFPVTGPNGTTPDPTVIAAVPRGINPDQPLNNLNGHNPFKPIRIEVKGGTPAGPVASTPTPDNVTTYTPPVTISRPQTPPSAINSALNDSGAFPNPTIPGTDSGTRPGITTGRSTSPVTTGNGGAFPRPTIPGTTLGGGVTAIGGSEDVKAPTINVPSGPTAGGPTAAGKSGSSAGNSNSNSSAEGGPTAQAPVVPPVAGVRVPNSVSVPQANASRGDTAVAGGNAGGSAGNPGLSTPAVITDLGGTGSVGANSIDAAISEHQLVFDAAVLGPVNTAIFRSDKGYIVATAGQPIPDTNIILQEVTASTATLVAGKDKKILELDKR